MIQPVVVEALFPHQMKKHTGVKVAAAGSHHETSCRSKTHRGIEGLAIQYRSQTRAVTEMSDHQTALGASPESEHDVLIRQTVKPISPNAFVPQVMRKRKPLSHFWHAAMKCGVETRYLRESWKARCHCIDALNGTRHVKRSKWNELTEFSQERCIYLFCCGVVRPAVDHSMAGGGGARKSRILC